jgi:hypothetical protein
MCSSTWAHLARICGAIEELAGRSGPGAGESAATDGSAAAAGVKGDTAADGSGRVSRPAADNERDGAEGEGKRMADDDVVGRLAEIWAMIAEADPGLAKRLPRYLGTGE